MAEREQLMTLATEIVSAHVSNNTVPPDQLPALIQQVFNTLATVDQKTAEPPKPDPAVPIKQSVKSGHIVRSSTDARAIPAPLELACVISPCRSELCQGAIGLGEEDRFGPEG